MMRGFDITFLRWCLRWLPVVPDELRRVLELHDAGKPIYLIIA